MKKAKYFFIALLAAVNLLGFAGTSLAFDLSKIYEKPVEFAKYVAQKLGFGDDEEEQKVKPDETLTVKESADFPYSPESNTEFFDLDLYTIDPSMPLFNDELRNIYGWQNYNEEINYNYGSEGWYFRMGSRTGEIFAPFAYKSANIPLWQTKVEYLTALPWDSFSQLSAELFIESTFSQQQVPGLNGLHPEYINEIYSHSPEYQEYGLRVNAVVKNAKIGLYGWYRNDADPLSTASLLDVQGASSDYLWRALNSDYYQGSNNLAATVSYELPFMSYFHQGMAPTVRLETAYKFGSNESENNNLVKGYDQWKVGMSYEGNNRLNWLNAYGINWGVGYNYTVTLDDLDIMDNLRRSNYSHSGNINANTYWFNMKLYTMIMYLYDRETRGSMTVLNATYSPDWRWSYGIKANIYYGKKEYERKMLNDNIEQVTFTATYRWD